MCKQHLKLVKEIQIRNEDHKLHSRPDNGGSYCIFRP
jgi:hypothetical protein